MRLTLGLALAAFTATAVAATPAGAATPRVRVIAECEESVQAPAYKPSMIVLACGDGGVYVTNAHWKSWTGKQASASAAAHINDCKPYCAAGHFHTFPVVITLSRPSGHPPLWRRASVRFTHARAAGYGTTFSYPLGGE